MPRVPRPKSAPTSKAGARSREQLIEAAGEVFAGKGFQGATSREICQKAGVNLAAVNYHFGGFEALYVDTLNEAHRRANWVSPSEAAGFEELPPREKLRAVLRNLVSRLSHFSATSWEVRLVSRELVLPTFAQGEFFATSLEPRRAFLRSIVGEILGLPAEDPLVGRCLFTVIAPSIMTSIIDRSVLQRFIPDFDSPTDGIKALVDHVGNFALAGLDAVVAEMRQRNELP